MKSVSCIENIPVDTHFVHLYPNEEYNVDQHLYYRHPNGSTYQMVSPTDIENLNFEGTFYPIDIKEDINDKVEITKDKQEPQEKMSLKEKEWSLFAQIVQDHIKNYAVKQYGDYDKPDEQISSLDKNTLQETLKKYVLRMNNGARGIEEETRDLLKIAHYACFIYANKNREARISWWESLEDVKKAMTRSFFQCSFIGITDNVNPLAHNYMVWKKDLTKETFTTDKYGKHESYIQESPLDIIEALE